MSGASVTKYVITAWLASAVIVLAQANKTETQSIYLTESLVKNLIFSRPCGYEVTAINTSEISMPQ